LFLLLSRAVSFGGVYKLKLRLTFKMRICDSFAKFSRKRGPRLAAQGRIKTAIWSIVSGGISSMLLASPVFAVANTNGLTALSLQGVGLGTLAGPANSCGSFSCASGNTCECLTGAESLVGNQGFRGGSLIFTLIVDETNTGLPVSTFGNCFPGTGSGTIANSNGRNTIRLNISGFACPTAGIDVFNGTYVVSGGTGKFNGVNGAGSINGSQDGPSGTSQATVSGSIQP